MRKKVLLVSLLLSLSLASCVAAPVPNVDSSQTSSTPGESTPTDPTTPAPNPDDIGPNQPTANNILHTDLSVDSTLSLRSASNNNAVINSRSSSVDYTSTYQKTVLTDVGGFQDYSYIQNTNGKVHNVYIDARDYNKTIVQPTDQNWADLGWISEIGISDFRNSDGGNTYTYGGGRAQDVLNSLTRMDLTDLFASGAPTLTLTVANGLVSNLTALTTPDASGNYYRLDVNILPAARPASLPTIPPGDDGASVLQNLVDDNRASYQVITNNTLNPNVIKRTTFNKEIVITETETTVGTNKSSVYNGFFLNPLYGWAEFASVNGNIEFITLPTQNIQSFEKLGIESTLNYGNFGSFFKWSDSSAQNTLVPIPYLENASDFIPFKLSEKSAIREYTIKMGVGTVGATQGKVTNINYDIVGEDGRVGKETLRFTYAPGVDANNRYNPANLNEIRKLSSTTQYTWKAEVDTTPSSQVWATLVSTFTQETVAQIPYLYAQPLTGKWTATTDASTGLVTVTAPDATSAGYPAHDWVNEYNQLLASDGYTVYSQNGDTNTYRKAGFNVEIGVKANTYQLTFKHTIQ